jgi:hypothetical protein
MNKLPSPQFIMQQKQVYGFQLDGVILAGKRR